MLTKKNEIVLREEQRIALFHKSNNETLQKWQQHATGIKTLKSSTFNYENGNTEKRIMHLKNNVPENEIIGIIVMQLRNLYDYFGFNISPEQLYETAEYIVEIHDFLSFTHIQHCFKMVKIKKYPFNNNLFNKIDGSKIMEYLELYQKELDNINFTEKKEVRKVEKNETKRIGTLAGIIGDMKKLEI